jgi:hypothetical protein
MPHPERTATLLGVCCSVLLVTIGYSQRQPPLASQNTVAAAPLDRGTGAEQALVGDLPRRTVSIYAGLGFLELAVLGVQYQIDDAFSVGVKAGPALIGGHDRPGGGFGGGLKGSYFLSRTGEEAFLSINVLNVEAAYLSASGGGALSLEATIGHDAMEGRGIGFLWLIGVGRGGFPEERDRALIFPAVKIGFHVNL